MATFTAFVGYDMTDLDFSALPEGTVEKGPTFYKVIFEDDTADTFTGFGLTYVDDTPISGTVTAWEYGDVSPASVLGKATGLSIPAVDIAAAAATETKEDDYAVIRDAFGGDDLINGSAFADVLFGADGDDEVNGNKGNDILLGGLGRDMLKGGKGKDTFQFAEKTKKSNVDKILDFKVNKDTIALDQEIFSKIGKSLSKKEFVIAKKAQDKNDYVVYNKKNGELMYDRNGSKKGGDQTIAELDKKLKLDHNDFDMI